MTLEERKLNLWLTLRKAHTLIHRILDATSTGDLDDVVITNIPVMEVLDVDLPALIEEMERDPIVVAAKAGLRNPT